MLSFLKKSILFCVMGIFSSCYAFDRLAGHHQLIVVKSCNWEASQGDLQLYERVDDDSVWCPIGDPIPVMLGESGMAWGIGLNPERTPSKVEGDLKAPAGIFSLGTAFGFASKIEMSHLKIEYLPIDPFTEAVDDMQSQYYNCIVNTQDVMVDWKSSEKMSLEPSYSLGFVVNHNFPNPKPGAGSAIFFHVWDGDPTRGCTSMSLENMASLLSWLDRSKNPSVVQLPISEYNIMQNDWGLP